MSGRPDLEQCHYAVFATMRGEWVQPWASAPRVTGWGPVDYAKTLAEAQRAAAEYANAEGCEARVYWYGGPVGWGWVNSVTYHPTVRQVDGTVVGGGWA